MRRALFVIVGWVILLASSCTQRMICPAYQSAFIYDQEALRKHFSYFNEDSTPKVITVSKDRYLMIPEQSYRKRIRSMQTIPMKPVYVKLPDSLLADKKNEFAGAEQDASDSIATKKKTEDDSVYAITKDKEVRVLKYDWDSIKYKVKNVTLNADQDNYMWYFRDVLVLPDVRAAIEDKKAAKENKASGGKKSKKKTGFLGFFKNMFKKKPKETATPTAPPAPTDSTGVVTPPSDSTAAPPPVKKKKGLFGVFKKKNADAKPGDKPKDPAKKEDDGF